MDSVTLGAAIAIAKQLPDTAAQRAETAQAAAEAAADRAATYACSVSVSNHKMIITTSD